MIQQIAGASETVDISSTDHTFTSKSICALYVGGGGTLVAQLAGDATSRDFGTPPAGTIIPGAFVKVIRSGTGATKMLGFMPNGEGLTGG